MLDEILLQISPYIWQILGIVLTTVVSYVGIKIKEIYESKINTEIKEKIVKSVVEMVEQISQKYNWTSDEKYNKAKETIIQMVNQTKLKITDLELDVLIESVCNSLKKI